MGCRICQIQWSYPDFNPLCGGQSDGSTAGFYKQSLDGKEKANPKNRQTSKLITLRR
jgi:hypothetical protein